MLHNFCKDTAPRHVRDFYLARLYRAASTDMTHYPVHDRQVLPGDDNSAYLPLPRTRPRGDDGRFVPRADEEVPVDNRDRKICGWCRTTSTSQWRVGPTTGSVEMGTLCNACGINYRRALAKSPDGTLNLDRLAQQMGHARLSIQKALKRQRKLSAPPHQFKRTRAPNRVADRFRDRPSDRLPMLPRAPLNSSSSSLTMLLAEDPARADAPRRQPDPVLDSPVYSIPPPPRPASYTPQSFSSTPPHLPAVPDYMTPSPPLFSTGVERGLSRMRPEDQSRLPPFQSFIGDLQRRSAI